MLSCSQLIVFYNFTQDLYDKYIFCHLCTYFNNSNPCHYWYSHYVWYIYIENISECIYVIEYKCFSVLIKLKTKEWVKQKGYILELLKTGNAYGKIKVKIEINNLIVIMF